MKKILIRLLVWAAVVSLLLPAASASSLAMERRIFDFLIEELGLNSAAACGVLANIEAESSFRLDTLGDSGTSYGLCQWHNVRFDNLKSFCLGQGYDYRTVEGQLNFMAYELRTTYQSTYAVLRNVPDTSDGAYTAAYYWCYYYERPATIEESSARRGRTARSKYWLRYGGKGASGETELSSQGYTGLLNQSGISQYSFYWDEEEEPPQEPEAGVVLQEEPEQSIPQQVIDAGEVQPFRFRYVPHHYSIQYYKPAQPVSGGPLSFLFVCAGPMPQPVKLPEPEECPEEEPEEAAYEA